MPGAVVSAWHPLHDVSTIITLLTDGKLRHSGSSQVHKTLPPKCGKLRGEGLMVRFLLGRKERVY
jgi:hypothetical protein